MKFREGRRGVEKNCKGLGYYDVPVGRREKWLVSSVRRGSKQRLWVECVELGNFPMENRVHECRQNI